MTESKKLWTAAEYISGGPFQLPPAFLGGERTKENHCFLLHKQKVVPRARVCIIKANPCRGFAYRRKENEENNKYGRGMYLDQ